MDDDFSGAWVRACTEATGYLEYADSGDPADEVWIRNNKRPQMIISCDRQELIDFANKIINDFGVVPTS